MRMRLGGKANQKRTDLMQVAGHQTGFDFPLNYRDRGFIVTGINYK